MWIQFLMSALLTVVGGIGVVFYAEKISQRTSLSRVWIGVMFLGLVTSLPELATTFFTTLKLKVPDLATGNILGSNLFNLWILVFLDLARKDSAILRLLKEKSSHYISLGLVILFSLLVLGGIRRNIFFPKVDGVGSESLAIIFFYIVGMRRLFKIQPPLLLKSKDSQSLIYVGFFFFAILVIISGIWLATTAKALSHITGWGATFIGSLFLASITSFPELVVSLSALKIASADMAVGNLLGSNMINLFILSLIDVFYIKAPLLSLVSPVHMITVGLVIIFCSVILISLRIRWDWSFLHLGWDTLFICIGYLIGMYFIFRLS